MHACNMHTHATTNIKLKIPVTEKARNSARMQIKTVHLICHLQLKHKYNGVLYTYSIVYALIALLFVPVAKIIS